MTQLPNLQRIERQAFSAKFKDGLVDIKLGLMMIGGYIISFISKKGDLDTKSAMVILIIYFLGAGLITFLGKKWITTPRMGTMKPGPARKKGMYTAGWTLAIMVLVQAVLILLQFTGAVKHDIGRLLDITFAGFIFFVPLVALAYFNDFTRGYLHAILVGGAVSSILAFGSQIPLLVAGSIALVVGVVVFIGFLRDYPLPEKSSGSVR